MRIRNLIGAAAFLLAAAPAWAAEGDIVLPSFSQTDWYILFGVLASAFIGLGYGYYLVRKVLREPAGTERMQEISDAIEEGAMASYGAGYVGMWLAVKANARTANAALTSYKNSLELGFRAGAVSGMFTVGFGLLGATIIFLLFAENAMRVLVGFGFGGSLAALFMRIGGGIFTKAADVGADLIGKVEKGIPEDDPRNAAVIADLVGDNVGDCAGMAADVFESYEVTLVAAIILGIAAIATGMDGGFGIKLVIYPLLVLALIIGRLTEHFTSTEKGPVTEIAHSTRTGPATMILTGLAEGLESSVWAIIAIAFTILVSFII